MTNVTIGDKQYVFEQLPKNIQELFSESLQYTDRANKLYDESQKAQGIAEFVNVKLNKEISIYDQKIDAVKDATNITPIKEITNAENTKV